MIPNGNNSPGECSNLYVSVESGKKWVNWSVLNYEKSTTKPSKSDTNQQTHRLFLSPPLSVSLSFPLILTFIGGFLSALISFISHLDHVFVDLCANFARLQLNNWNIEFLVDYTLNYIEHRKSVLLIHQATSSIFANMLLIIISRTLGRTSNIYGKYV